MVKPGNHAGCPNLSHFIHPHRDEGSGQKASSPTAQPCVIKKIMMAALAMPRIGVGHQMPRI
jgi:hypothetical protein